MVEDVFNVNFTVENAVASDPELLKVYGAQCRMSWVEQLYRVGGKLIEDKDITVGLVEMTPDDLSGDPAAVGIESLRFVQVSGTVLLPPPDPRYAEGALEKALTQAVDDVLSESLGIRGAWTQGLDKPAREGILAAMNVAFDRVITEYRG